MVDRPGEEADRFPDSELINSLNKPHRNTRAAKLCAVTWYRILGGRLVMAGRNGKKIGAAGFCLMGAGASAFFAAAALATGSAAPAKADFEDLLDPIIQPLLTSVTDSIAGFDPAAAVDVTSWADSLLSSLNSVDLAVPGMDAAPAVAASATTDAASADSPTTGVYVIPIDLQSLTDPTVQATIDGGSPTNLLLDTGSSGLVVPFTNFDGNSYNFFTELENFYDLGVPVGFGESSAGGVDYLYATYDGVSVDYDAFSNDTFTDLTTNTPIEEELYSWDPSNLGTLFSNDAFQNLLTSDGGVSGIMGIGEGASGSAGVSPLAGAGFDGVAVDITPFQVGGGLVVDDYNPFTAIVTLPSTGATPTGDLYETVTYGSQTLGSSVSDDLDTGGGYGTIPSSLTGDLGVGSEISVYTSDGGTPLYSYMVDNSSEIPTTTSGTAIDSGMLPFLYEPIYLSYAGDTLSFDEPQPGDLGSI
jgi:hypothetical protein